MKNLVIRIVFVLTLLLTLGAVFGTVNVTSAHAATTHANASVTPDINNVGCTDSSFLQIHSFTAGEWCYANAGRTPITIPELSYACTGNNDVDFYTTNGTLFGSRWTCAGFAGAPTLIGINIR